MFWFGDFGTDAAFEQGRSIIQGFCSQLNDPVMTARLACVGLQLLDYAVNRNQRARSNADFGGTGEGVMFSLTLLPNSGVQLIVKDEGGKEVFQCDEVRQYCDLLTFNALPGGLLTIACLWFGR